jgi:hypothetical protein
MPGVMSRDAAANDRIPVAMSAHLWMLLDETLHEFTAQLATLVSFGAAAERCFRRSFIAAPTRWQKNDRRQQIVFTERGQQGRGWHFRHAEFHVISFSALPPDVR